MKAPVEKFQKSWMLFGGIGSKGLIPADGPVFCAGKSINSHTQKWENRECGTCMCRHTNYHYFSKKTWLAKRWPNERHTTLNG